MPPLREPAKPGETYRPPGQVGVREVLVLAQLLVAVQQDAGALEGVAVLVRVGGDRGHARDAEVPRRHLVAEALDPREQPAAEAAVDVQADAPRPRQLGELLDRVDEAVRVVAGAADQRDRLVVDEVGHGGDVGEIAVGERRVPHLDVHPVRALVQRAVRGHRHDQVGPGHAAGARLLAVRVQRGHQALRAAAGHDADARPVQEVGGHGDDLALELGRARVHVALQDVGVGELVEHLAEEVVVGVVAGVDAARHRALVAERVLGVGQAGDLGQDGILVDGLRRHAPEGLGRAPVRVEVAEDLLEARVAHLSHPSLLVCAASLITPPSNTGTTATWSHANEYGMTSSSPSLFRRWRWAAFSM